MSWWKKNIRAKMLEYSCLICLSLIFSSSVLFLQPHRCCLARCAWSPGSCDCLLPTDPMPVPCMWLALLLPTDHSCLVWWQNLFRCDDLSMPMICDFCTQGLGLSLIPQVTGFLLSASSLTRTYVLWTCRVETSYWITIFLIKHFKALTVTYATWKLRVCGKNTFT